MPSQVQQPYKISTTQASITIGWSEPSANGCPLTGFAIFRDTGNNDALTVQVDPSNVGSKPSLRQYTVDYLGPVSASFRFKIRAFNYDGYTDSRPLMVVLSAVPDTPLTGPISDATVTDNSKIKVNYGPSSVSQNGGSEILSYELQKDDGAGGAFESLIGAASNSLETTYTIAYNITGGGLYRFRYRCLNVNGWSGWSPPTYIRAATVPVRPPAPVFVTATATSITLSLSPSSDDRGSHISTYRLSRNTGGTSTTYVLVTSYTGTAQTATITTTADGLVAGTIYKFVYSAVNSYGSSDTSNQVDCGVSSFPAQPSPPTKVAAASGQTYISLSWLKSADTELPVLGYVLNMDDGYGGAFSVIYNGRNYPQVL